MSCSGLNSSWVYHMQKVGHDLEGKYKQMPLYGHMSFGNFMTKEFCKFLRTPSICRASSIQLTLLTKRDWFPNGNVPLLDEYWFEYKKEILNQLPHICYSVSYGILSHYGNFSNDTSYEYCHGRWLSSSIGPNPTFSKQQFVMKCCHG